MIDLAFAMAPPPAQDGAAPAGGGGLLTLLPPMIMAFLIIYFVLIRPQKKEHIKHQEMLDQLQEGDNVVTRGGIHGTIKKIKDDIITVQIAENIRVKVDRSSINRLRTETPREKPDSSGAVEDAGKESKSGDGGKEKKGGKKKKGR